MATKKITVEVVRSTAKAHLVKAADGRQGWIQRRWLSSENTVSETTLAKSAASMEGREQAKASANEWRQASHPCKVARETEKAVAIEIVFEAANAEREISRLAWFPKSAIGGAEGVALIPGWMIDDRVDRVREELIAQHGHGLGLMLVSSGIIREENEVAA